ncbi:GNAT family N-acetyltransferase [Micromonospora lupini]|uniref:GNAT family N-acetyltransferase n=1 Tax=Micromonospora lupini TaxID=285679 RepID=UPI00225C2784|nr:GNAT family N-acetyltransferase [Micromonospora lupini]MCX5065715.1 GNAT family N-acetyltransferase [Micromonospora lupini]
MNTIADRMAAAYDDAIENLCGATPQGWYAKRGTARGAVTHAGAATLNVAYDLSPEPDLEALDELATEVSRQVPVWSIMVRGAADGTVADLAGRHGLRDRSELPLLGCTAGELVFRADPARRELVRRVGAAESDRYTDVLTRGFEVPEGLFGSLMGGDVLAAESITGYLCEEAGRPVGTGLAMRTRGVVGVFNIAVVPSARGRGLGRVITEEVLRDGVAAGADAAYLQSSALGRPLYESMGFRLLKNWTAFHA